jgi:D-amino-acid dehydrogenase
MQNKHVIVVGGGMIGLCTAHALQRDGHRVSIIERERLGSGAAKGNAGELTPQQVTPLASPNTARDIVRGVFSRNSYLSIDPRQLLALARFGIGFLLASRTGQMRHGERALAALSRDMLPALERFADDGIDIGGGGSGFLVTAENRELLAAAHQGYVQRAAQGWGQAPGEILQGKKLRKYEPALARDVTGAFLLPEEFSLDSITFIDSLAEHIRAAGANIHTGYTAKRMNHEHTAVECVTDSGETHTVSGDCVVVALGAWTTQFLRDSEIPSTQVVPGKGYSFTLPVEQMPNTVLHSLDRHCVATPMHDRLRIVGMMEFDNRPHELHADRISKLKEIARYVVGGGDWNGITDEWVGARPMTFDGLPMLGAVPGRPGVLVASGHNMHGLSLGPVTGEVIAQLVSGREPNSNGQPLDLTPFRVRRGL